MQCVRTVSMRVNWNGELSKTFLPSRGVRQSDLLSPYLFALCIAWLAQAILHEVDKGNWKAIRLNRGGSTIIHLLFADDPVLFVEASQDKMALMNVVLDEMSKD